MPSTKFLENAVILGFEKRYAYPKQNSVVRLKPNSLAPTKFFCFPPNFWARYTTTSHIALARGKRSHDPPKFLECIVILCFERWYPKQNSVFGLKSNILAPEILR